MTEVLKNELRQLIQEEFGKVMRRDESEKDLLTVKDVAKLFRCQPQTLNLWRVRGKGPGYIKLNGAVRYQREEVMRWLEKNMVNTY